jgi:hypothetical protein
MQRRFLALMAAVAAAAFTPLAGASGSYDYVVGGGERATQSGETLNHFAVSAHDGPNGVTGNYHVEAAGPGASSFDVDVKCTYMDGNQALIGGVITHQVNRPGLDGVGFAVAFQDNGNPAGGGTPDRVSFNDFFLEPGRTPPMTQADCAAEAATVFLDAFQPMAAGDVEVFDAP